jgi:hypothetical protein
MRLSQEKCVVRRGEGSDRFSAVIVLATHHGTRTRPSNGLNVLSALNSVMECAVKELNLTKKPTRMRDGIVSSTDNDKDVTSVWNAKRGWPA